MIICISCDSWSELIITCFSRNNVVEPESDLWFLVPWARFPDCAPEWRTVGRQFPVNFVCFKNYLFNKRNASLNILEICSVRFVKPWLIMANLTLCVINHSSSTWSSQQRHLIFLNFGVPVLGLYLEVRTWRYELITRPISADSQSVACRDVVM